MQRVLEKFPRQGDRMPWMNPQDYGRDKTMIRTGALEDGVLKFANPPVVARTEPMLQAAE